MRRTLEERFWAKVNKNGPGGCWDWTASLDSREYGQIRIDGKNKRAHRVSYELHNGPIPEGLCVCHKCDRRICVNPKCLFLGTVEDNNRDRDEKGRQVALRGSAHWYSKLNETQVSLIKKFFDRHSGYGSGAFLGRWFGVSRDTISHIKLGKYWKHVKEGI